MLGHLLALALTWLTLAQAAKAPVKPPSATGRWVLKSDVSKMDDSKTVTLSLRGSNAISGWPNKTATPTLILRCKEGSIGAYVVTGMAANVESGNLDGATVTVRFDREPPRRLDTEQSTDHEALFFTSPKDLILEMEEQGVMLFRFTPFNSSPQETSFALRGLRTAITPLKEACSWDPEREAQERLQAELERLRKAAEEAKWWSGQEAKADEAKLEAALVALRSGDERSKAMTACDVGELKTPRRAEAIPFLIAGLKGSDRNLRLCSAVGLGGVATADRADAIAALEDAMGDPTRGIVEQARNALAKIRGQQ